MSGKSINFEEKKISKSNFYKNKKLFKILVSKKESYGSKNSFKYFIGYKNDDVIRPVCIKLPQMIGYVKCFDSNKIMSFKVTDNKLLKKYNKIWQRLSNLLSTKFDSKPIYDDKDKYIKTKIKLYGDKIDTNFRGKKIPKENASYKCLSLIMTDPLIRANKKYYPQTLLAECKHEIKKSKVEYLINDDLDPSSSDESDSESDNKCDNGSDNETDD